MWLALSHHENGQTTITENMPFSSASNFFGKRMAAAVYNPTDVMVMICSILALYNSFELLALIFITFKRWRGLYFWSMFITTFALIPYSLGWLLDYFDLVVNLLGMVFNSIRWILLVTGQSVVLYSRLHLVLYDERILRGVLWMIIVNGCVWHITMTVLLYTTTHGSSRKGNHNPQLYNTLEKVQLTFFCAQEFIISGLYIWKVVDILKTSLDENHQKRLFMWYLFGVNVIIVTMDIGLLAIMYANHFLLEQGVKMVIYSIKLKLEFATLGKLVEFVKTRGGSHQTGSSPHHNTTGFIELSSNRSRPGDKKSRSSSNPDTVGLEDVASGSGTSSRQANEQAVATKRTVPSSEPVSDAEDMNSNQLYEAAVRQMSRG